MLGLAEAKAQTVSELANSSGDRTKLNNSNGDDVAKTKEKPKPLFPLKQDFYVALDNYTQAAGNLASAIGMLLRGDTIPGPIAEILKERLAEFEAARWEN